MTITIKEVKHLSRLAQLEFSPEEVRTLKKEVNRIVILVEKLKDLDTAEMRPLDSMEIKVYRMCDERPEGDHGRLRAQYDMYRAGRKYISEFNRLSDDE